MTKKEYYLHELAQAENWTDYLLSHSNLPGPRANLELMQAFVELGSEKDFLPLLDYTPETAPENTPEEFLCFCGTVGLGEIIVNGMREYLPDLREKAADSRWRIREAVALALQIIGRFDFYLLSFICQEWVKGTLLEQRALAAGIAEPGLLKDPRHAEIALQLLEQISNLMAGVENRKTDEFKILRKGLGYCWSVAITALPEMGKIMFENLADLGDPDIHWVIRENLRKKRLLQMDEEWVIEMLNRLQ